MKKILMPAILLLHLGLLYNLQFTAWPEMYSYPYLVNNGFKLYQDIIYPYPPLLTMILAKLYLYFGYSIWTLKIFTWILLLTNDFLIFKIGQKLIKNNLQIYLGLLFYFLAQSILEGNMMWFDVAIVTPLLAALYLTISLQKSINKYQRRSFFLLIGFMLTLATLTKQTTAIFLILYFIYFIYQKIKLSEFANYIFAPVFMSGLLVLKLVMRGSFTEAFNWTLLYPFKFWSKVPGYVEMSLDKKEVYIILILLLPAVVALYNFKIKQMGIKLAFSIYLLISLLIIYPRFSFFHFQLGIAIVAICVTFLKPKYISILLLMFLFTVFMPRYRVFANSSTRFIGETEKNLAADIHERVSPDETVYLLNIHSGIYNLANRLPPKPWFDNFAWYLEIPGVQLQFLSRWEVSPPDYVYLQSPEPGIWHELGTYLPKDLLVWMKENYDLIDTYRDSVQIYKYKSYTIPTYARI